MKTTLRVAIIALGSILVLSVGLLRIVSADDSSAPVTDDQIARIRATCTTTKNTLNQLHISDAYLRVDRGQLYESIMTNLMQPFEQRLANNHVDTSTLTSLTDSYNGTLDTFRSDYQAYEQQLSTALSIDCTKQPVTFYDDVIAAQTLRDTVHSDVLKLNADIDSFGSSVSDIAKTYEVTN